MVKRWAVDSFNPVRFGAVGLIRTSVVVVSDLVASQVTRVRFSPCALTSAIAPWRNGSASGFEPGSESSTLSGAALIRKVFIWYEHAEDAVEDASN